MATNHDLTSRWAEGLTQRASSVRGRRAGQEASVPPTTMNLHDIKTTVGRCEWLALPDFGIACIQARLDIRSSESRLSALDVVILRREGRRQARFSIRPIPGDERTAVVAEAPLAPRSDDDPAGEPVIRTLIKLGEESWPIDLRLVPHDTWRFRLRLGRPALDGRCTVDPKKSFLAGPPSLG